jgi:hypothetical protein
VSLLWPLTLSVRESGAGAGATLFHLEQFRTYKISIEYSFPYSSRNDAFSVSKFCARLSLVSLQ